MNDDDPLADVEARLRTWRPADLPPALHARLQSARPAARPANRWSHGALAGAFALLLGVVLAGRFAPSPEHGAGATARPFPASRHAADRETTAEPRWVLGESLTMNICTGVPAGIIPAALRLDEDAEVGSSLIFIRSPDGKLPLKVDCQF